MSVFDQTTNSTQERPEAQVWLNVGLNLPMIKNGAPVIDETTKEPVMQFVSLPLGIAVDNMEAIAKKGTNADWLAFVDTRNTLLNYVEEQGKVLSSGETKILDKLQVEIRRVNKKQVTSATASNPMIDSLRSALSGKPANDEAAPANAAAAALA